MAYLSKAQIWLCLSYIVFSFVFKSSGAKISSQFGLWPPSTILGLNTSSSIHTLPGNAKAFQHRPKKKPNTAKGYASIWKLHQTVQNILNIELFIFQDFV